MNTKLSAKITLKPRFRSNDPIEATFELTNKGAGVVHVLPWGTPLEGLLTDCLEVTRDGEPVPYDGPLIKRGVATKEHYVRIRPGQTIRNEIDISRSYHVAVPGRYEVRAKDVVADTTTTAQLRRLSKAAALERVPEPAAARSRPRKFQVRAGIYYRATEGEMARRMEEVFPNGEGLEKKGKAQTKSKKLAKGKTPTLVGGTASQKKAALKAFGDGYDLAVAALKGLKNDSKYAEWFGRHSASRFNKVKSTYTAVKKGMDTQTFTYNLTGQGCKPSVFAYTYKGSTTIWFCSAFWSAPALGTDSKAGTVLHEHSHASASTDDVTYGQTNCRALAKNNPNDAVRNADSYEYYAGG